MKLRTVGEYASSRIEDKLITISLSSRDSDWVDNEWTYVKVERLNQLNQLYKQLEVNKWKWGCRRRKSQNSQCKVT